MFGFVAIYLLVGVLYSVDSILDMQDAERWQFFVDEVVPMMPISSPRVAAAALIICELVIWPTYLVAGCIPFSKTRLW